MPKLVGRKASRVAKAHEQERAATEAVTAGLEVHKPTSKRMRDLLAEAKTAREAKESARKHHAYEFDCSFCRRKFRSPHVLTLEVPVATEHDIITRTYTSDSTGDSITVEEFGEVREIRDRTSPHYLIACPKCLPMVWEALTE